MKCDHQREANTSRKSCNTKTYDVYYHDTDYHWGMRTVGDLFRAIHYLFHLILRGHKHNT